MAFVVTKGAGRFEIREAIRTDRGPRSRTLATFDKLTPEVLERARSRASIPLDERELVRSARRVGAVVTESDAAAAGAALYKALADGRQLRPALARLITAALPDAGEPTDAEVAAGAWLGRTPSERGDALRDLLALADRLPARGRPSKLGFPRLP